MFYEEKYPSILFAKDGEIFDLNGKQTVVIGGAYSIDKAIRIAYGWGWWEDEQPSEEIKQYVEQQLTDNNWKVDVVLSHTTPLKYEPVEVFLSGVDQSWVDKSTEEWLDAIGLQQLEDKEKIHSKIQKFLPDTLEFDIGDFDFTDESYSKIEGKLFQILFVHCKEIELPYVWMKDSNGAEVGCIFYRRGTKTVKANMQEINDMIDKRIEASYVEQSSLQLEEHLKQLDTLYKYISPNSYSLSAFDKLFRSVNKTMSNGAIIAGTSNPNYPKESYEEFIAKMIERKKKKIEKVLDLK